MKIKQQVSIIDPKAFLAGSYDNCFVLTGYDVNISGWINCGYIEIEVDVDRKEAINITMSALEEQEEKVKEEFDTKMALLEISKKELLCLEAP